MKRIVCFGDSNTYGYVPALGDRFDGGTRWSGILKSRLAEKNIEVVEEGVNGRTTVFDDPVSDDRNGSTMLGAVLGRNDPADLLVIMLGTNDCKVKFGADAVTITEGLEVLVSMARLFDPRIRILLVAPPVINDGVLTGRFAENFDAASIEKSKQLAARYGDLARRTGCAFMDASVYASTDRSDGIHMNADSHKSLSEAVTGFIGQEFPELFSGN